MKKTLKKISTVSIVLFGLLWILSLFNILKEFNLTEIRSFFVLIYLFSSLIYFKMEVKDKNAEIQDLKLKLKNKI